ncbi:hypothetical protein COU37_05905 [Candidatus Micrarchaeota archaeon CG10_big_fil_rev_8_21_14_0_10_45_29]|nr:MAG: hypothetical protein COU37_05905 [Candidatus Micrarchaeota archaeon CG10_big_fil_rev_8_21_14_0_10_45_29]
MHFIYPSYYKNTSAPAKTNSMPNPFTIAEPARKIKKYQVQVSCPKPAASYLFFICLFFCRILRAVMYKNAL